MLKTAIFGSAILFGAAAPATQLADTQRAGTEPATAEATALNLPAADVIIAQFSYLEVSHGDDGFGFAITDNADIFVDLEFPGDVHIRIGF